MAVALPQPCFSARGSCASFPHFFCVRKMEVSLGRRVLIVETVWEQRGQANRVGSVRRQWLGVWPQPFSESTRSATAGVQTEPCPQEGTLSPTEEE